MLFAKSYENTCQDTLKSLIKIGHCLAIVPFSQTNASPRLREASSAEFHSSYTPIRENSC